MGVREGFISIAFIFWGIVNIKSLRNTTLVYYYDYYFYVELQRKVFRMFQSVIWVYIYHNNLLFINSAVVLMNGRCYSGYVILRITLCRSKKKIKL